MKLNNIGLKDRVLKCFPKQLNEHEFYGINIHILKVTLFFSFVFMMLALAWLSDDAYHSFVMSRNLANGYGFVYNLDDRVLVATSPLFTAIVGVFFYFLRNMYVVGILMGIITSSIALYFMLFKLEFDFKKIIFLVFSLASSYTYITYTTSGLENSLLHLLAILIFYVTFFVKDQKLRYKAMMYLYSSLILTRYDAALIFLPLMIVEFLMNKNLNFKFKITWAILGALPFVIWSLFSLWYYGLLFPNTAYAKLNSNYALLEYMYKGLSYYLITFISDPISMIILFVAIVVGIFIEKDIYKKSIILGVALYSIYIIRIGGDFMVGRFFSTIFLISLIYILSTNFVNRLNIKKISIVLMAVTFIYLNNIQRSLIINIQHSGKHAITDALDERQAYYDHTGLILNVSSYLTSGKLLVMNKWDEWMGDRVIKDIAINRNVAVDSFAPGIAAYKYIEQIHMWDDIALGDAFLTRMKPIVDETWRVGHIQRVIPEGYIETLEYGENVIQDKKIAEYYEIMKVIIKGDLFDLDRLALIIDFNLGKYDYLIK